MRILIGGLLAAASLWAGPLTKVERDRLVAHLDWTGEWLAQETAGLSKAQAEFRPGEGKWSILEVLDHLTVAEPHYWTTLKDSMKEAPSGEKGEADEAAILWYGIDRTDRNKTAEAREPKGQFKETAPAFEAFRKLRASMLEYARTTEEDLRAHRYLKGRMDCYQWFVMISAHAQRHIMQIREIKAHPQFPRK